MNAKTLFSVAVLTTFVVLPVSAQDRERDPFAAARPFSAADRADSYDRYRENDRDASVGIKTSGDLERGDARRDAGRATDANRTAEEEKTTDLWGFGGCAPCSPCAPCTPIGYNHYPRTWVPRNNCPGGICPPYSGVGFGQPVAPVYQNPGYYQARPNYYPPAPAYRAPVNYPQPAPYPGYAPYGGAVPYGDNVGRQPATVPVNYNVPAGPAPANPYYP